MSKVTPAVFRLAAVLKLFAKDPARSWTLTEIVAELGISRSTCHALLVSLDETNIIYRDSAKRYSLGSLAASVGRAASDFALEADVVRRELESISRDFGVISVTNYRRQDGILVRDWVDPVRRRHKPAVAGSTIPLTPPWGAVFYAWESDAEQRSWLARASSIGDNADVLQYVNRGLREIRRRRYVCGIRAEGGPDGCFSLLGRRTSRRTDHFFWDISGSKAYAVDFLAAPVLDAAGNPILAISITGFGTKMSGAAIEELGANLAARCRKLGQSLVN
jgi:DNA-binding IclR family transcriptional regulator